MQIINSYAMYSIPPIKNLDELKRILHTGPGYEGYATVLQSIEFGPEELADFCSWSEDKYTKKTIESIPSIDLEIICWEPGQETAVHDHANRESWFYVLEGELQETVFYKPGENPEPLHLKSKSLYKDKEVGYMTDNHGLHKLKNSSSDRTISIHLYSEPYGNVHHYDEQTGEVIN